MSETSEREPLFIVDEVGDDFIDVPGYPYRVFDVFFRDRPGWLPTDPDGPAVRDWFYDESFSDRDRIVRPDVLNVLPMFATPAEGSEGSNRVLLYGPFLDLSTMPKPSPEQVLVDLDAPDAADRVAELERRARAVSSIELVRRAVHGEV